MSTKKHGFGTNFALTETYKDKVKIAPYELTTDSGGGCGLLAFAVFATLFLFVSVIVVGSLLVGLGNI
jgi:hypothetical protein